MPVTACDSPGSPYPLNWSHCRNMHGGGLWRDENYYQTFSRHVTEEIKTESLKELNILPKIQFQDWKKLGLKWLPNTLKRHYCNQIVTKDFFDKTHNIAYFYHTSYMYIDNNKYSVRIVNQKYYIKYFQRNNVMYLHVKSSFLTFHCKSVRLNVILGNNQK